MTILFIASLDISKAFDRVNHYKLYKSLLCAGIPVVVVDVLCNLYSKLTFMVRWNSSVSAQFLVGSGVRQGSCLSPAIFNVFISVFYCTDEIVTSWVSCYVIVRWLYTIICRRYTSFKSVSYWFATNA